MSFDSVQEWDGRRQLGIYSGHAWRYDDKRWYWYAFHTELANTVKRDGAVEFTKGRWRSRGGARVSFPYAVIDDFGALRPVPLNHELTRAGAFEEFFWWAPSRRRPPHLP